MRPLITITVLLLLLFIAGCSDDSGVSITPTLVTPPQSSPINVAGCKETYRSEDFNLATWNIERFPMQNDNTVDDVVDIIEQLDLDLIAIQEISRGSAFNDLIQELDGWDGRLANVSGDIELGFLYKTSEISSITDLQLLFNDDFSAFPREAVMTTVQHTSGIQSVVVNIHLKCCDDGFPRRREASILLKDYIDTNLSEENVIVLGDFNDELGSGSPFSNFIDDSVNYLFTDYDIDRGSSDNFSYPSFPSHIDHILITNELFQYHQSTKTLILDDCIEDYDERISDHRPVVVTFTL